MRSAGVGGWTWVAPALAGAVLASSCGGRAVANSFAATGGSSQTSTESGGDGGASGSVLSGNTGGLSTTGGAAGAGQGGDAGAGGSQSCVPGTTIACFDGPDSRRAIGACHEGRATCADDGSGYGDCLGQVLPEPEVCATGIDENCDGLIDEGDETGPCLAAVSSGVTLGSQTDVVTLALHAPDDGTLWLGGRCSGSLQMGGKRATCGDWYSGFVVHVAADDSVPSLWTFSAEHAQVTDLASAADGRLLVAGTAMNALAFGGRSLPGDGELRYPFLGRLDADGNADWVVAPLADASLLDPSAPFTPRVARIEFYGSSAVAFQLANSLWISEHGSAGVVADQMTVQTGQRVPDAAILGGAEPWAASSCAGDVSVLRPLPAADSTYDVCLVPLSITQNDSRREQRFTRPHDQHVVELLRSDNRIVVVGYDARPEEDVGFVLYVSPDGQRVEAEVDLPGHAPSAADDAPDGSVVVAGKEFLARLDASGRVVFARTFRGQAPSGVAALGARDVAVTGRLSFDTDFGAGPIATTSWLASYLVKLPLGP